MILNVCSHFGLEAQDMKLEPCLCSERGRRSRRPHRRPPAWSAQSSGRCSGCTSTESWTFEPGTGEILAWGRSGNPECVRAVAAAAVAVVEVCKAVEPSSCSDLNDLWTMCGPAKNKINRFFLKGCDKKITCNLPKWIEENFQFRTNLLTINKYTKLIQASQKNSIVNSNEMIMLSQC